MVRRPSGWRGEATLGGDRFDWVGRSARAPGPIGFTLAELARARLGRSRSAPFGICDFTLRDGRALSFLGIGRAAPAWFEGAGFQVLVSPARPEVVTVLPPGEPFEWADIGR
jgi:hypothetical protein